MTTISILKKAQAFFRAAHDSISQKRKYTGEPYYNHTEAVAKTVAEYGGTEEMQIIALGHDTIEDVFPFNTFYSPERIEREFGLNVRLGVVALTNVFTRESYPTWNRRRRHDAEAYRLATVQPHIATIKLADIKCNTSDILWQDPEFAKVYLREKAYEIQFLVHGDSLLFANTKDQILTGLQRL